MRSPWHILFLTTILAWPFAATTAATTEPALAPMPILAMYCDSDPGPVSPGGGRGQDPQMLLANGACTPAEGVSLTFVLASGDPTTPTPDATPTWFGRCDITAEGSCDLQTPTGPDALLNVYLHTSTVKPGYAPTRFLPTAQNITEFAGYGLVLTPTGDPVGEPADNQTIALKIDTNGAPAEVLTHWDNGNLDQDHLPHSTLATNADGWVSQTTTADQTWSVNLIGIEPEHAVSTTCSGIPAAGATVPAIETSVSGTIITITVPQTDADIRCDISITN